MASRFWAGSSSEEENSDYSSDSSTEATTTRPTSRWAIDSDSESDDEVRVVRSGKDKAFDQLEKHCQALKNFTKINNWLGILSEFDTMSKLLEKQKTVLTSATFPKSYWRTMIQLEDASTELIENKAQQKKLGKENSKAFIRMKGKLKKHFEPLKEKLAEVRLHPESEEEAEDSDSDSEDDDDSSDDESDSESEADSTEDEKEQKIASKDDSEDDDWPSESESDSSSDSEDDDDGQLKGRAKWLKSATVTSSKRAGKGPKVPRVAKERKASIDVEKKEEELLSYTPAEFDFKLREVISMRGKRGTSLADLTNQLRKLAHYSRVLGDARQIMALIHVVGAVLFDTTNRIDTVLDTVVWRTVLNDLLLIVKLLESNPGFRLQPLTSEDQADIMRAGRGDVKEEEMVAMKLPAAGQKGVLKVSGDLASFVDRLSDEFIKSLQQTDPHTSDYISRLYDEGGLLEIARRVKNFCDRQGKTLGASKMALLQVEYSYYKHTTIAAALHGSQIRREKFGDPLLWHPSCSNSSTVQATPNFAVVHPGSVSGKPTCDVPVVDFEKELNDLCMFVYKNGDDRSKTRAMLCQIYHNALHDRFSEARDLLLMSHLQETIGHTDIPTQILFNRMMAQLGLCAFRQGLISEAHGCLMEICTGARTKELLAQGIQTSRFASDRNAEQEKIERRRQTPYHMHVNLELLECCHLTAAMLLEIPNLAAIALDGRKRVISKTFRRHLDFYDRQVFCGPPENTRDHVITAAKCLSKGAWQECRDLILNLPLWNLLPGQGVSQRVKDLVGLNIQIQGLRTYLLAHSSEYDSLSLPELCGMFELPEKKVHSVVSKMMINEELQASWDQRTQSIVMHQIERTKLQYLSLQFAEKAALLVENNERMLDYRNVNKEDWHHRSEDRNSSTKRGGTRNKGSRW